MTGVEHTGDLAKDARGSSSDCDASDPRRNLPDDPHRCDTVRRVNDYQARHQDLVEGRAPVDHEDLLGHLDLGDLNPDEYGSVSSTLRLFMAREGMVRRYAWAIPTAEAIAAIAKLSPIVEVGAGSGYWTSLLREQGATVEPFDKHPDPSDNSNISHRWLAVQHGTPAEALTGGRERWTLFLCWPSYEGSWAAEALELHTGAHVCYIGEGPGGCTADDRFFELLEERYEQVDEVSIPQWYGIHDSLSIWQRRSSVTSDHGHGR